MTPDVQLLLIARAMQITIAQGRMSTRPFLQWYIFQNADGQACHSNRVVPAWTVYR